MITKILLGYDGSANARRALEVASELSSRLEVDLSIVHVLMHDRPPEELIQMAEVEHLVEEVHNTLWPGVNYTPELGQGLLKPADTSGEAVRVISVMGDHLVAYAKSHSESLGARSVSTAVRTGDYADEILDAATEQGADMIVIGSRGLGVLKGTVLGSVSQKVLHHADQIVVTVR